MLNEKPRANNKQVSRDIINIGQDCNINKQEVVTEHDGVNSL